MASKVHVSETELLNVYKKAYLFVACMYILIIHVDMSTLSTCQPCRPVNLVDLSTLSTCRPVNPVDLSTLSTCQSCRPVNPVDLSTLLTCQTCRSVNPVDLSTLSTCQHIRPVNPVDLSTLSTLSTGTRSKIFNEIVLKDKHLLTLHEKCIYITINFLLVLYNFIL